MQILHNTKYKYRPTKVYNLDVIISVGYRVKSKRGTLFRQWANKVLKDYLLKGYSVNRRFEQLEQRVSRTEEKIEQCTSGAKIKINSDWDGETHLEY